MQLVRLIPNLLTLLRVVLTPWVGFAILRHDYWRALAICCLAGVTDTLDGALARRFGSESQVGAYLDPVADKLMLSTIYLMLAAAKAAPWWLVGAVIGRDIFILSGTGVLLIATRIRRFPPSIWGKLSTVLQILTVLVILIDRAAGWGAMGTKVVNCMMYLVLLAAVGTALHYTWRSMKALAQGAETTHVDVHRRRG